MSRIAGNQTMPSAARIDRALRRRVNAKWSRVPQFAWGDRLDARFYMVAQLGTLRGAKVLDVGCNAGILLSEVGQTNWKVGLDLDARALAAAREQFPDARYLRGDMFHLPFHDGAFDVVICCGMLELPPPGRKAALMREAARVLKTGGRLYLTTPNKRNLHYWVRTLDAVTYEELAELLSPHFEASVYGFNPFPAFPRFLPNRWLAAVPGIWTLLGYLMARRVNVRGAHGFYAEGMKR